MVMVTMMSDRNERIREIKKRELLAEEMNASIAGHFAGFHAMAGDSKSVYHQPNEHEG